MMLPTLPDYSVSYLRYQRRRVEHRRAGAARVITAMRDHGLALHVSHEKSGNLWWLSDGSSVTPEVAEIVIAHPDIASVGDGLFRGALGQTYRPI
jgi:hypothetical protein